MMQEIKGDLFESDSLGVDAIVITTNGWVSKSQCANTMGAGVAKEAKVRWPGIQITLGMKIRDSGNHCHLITSRFEKGYVLKTPKVWPDHNPPYHVISFPVKPERCSKEELLDRFKERAGNYKEFYGWMAKAQPELIERSAKELKALADREEFAIVALPWPGCGNGGLSVEEIRPILEKHLDDRFWIVNYG
jgi:O-acetyl-ADP-ribose deacetylase (regulator of RNase III)